MAYSNKRLGELDKSIEEIHKNYQQTKAEMDFLLKHRFKIWVFFIAFWSLVFWLLFK